MNKGFIVLESGEVFSGLWHGGRDRAGEVVFNTSHSGYEEIATDPSYMSQIVVLTAPMQGNYGVDDSVWESRRIWIEGFVCVALQSSERDQDWKNRLIDAGVPIVSELDTRALVLRLREKGTPWGAIVSADSATEATTKANSLIQKAKLGDRDWAYFACQKEARTVQGQVASGPKLALLDFGSKENILRECLKYCSEVKVFPSRATYEQIMAYKPDGVVLSNGPGDPVDVQGAPETVRKFIGQLPLFGICMGHQILGLALGGRTYKLKFGHRGSNHPIKDTLLNRIYMTSQNHGYAVENESLPSDVKVTHVNLNDQTVAGVFSEKRKLLGIQFHPESCPGPNDSRDLFKFFITKMLRG